MSARFSGRQSPPPELQSGKQGGSPFGSGHVDPKYAPSSGYAPKSAAGNESQTAGLTSNPEHILEEIEAAKYKKGTGNPTHLY